VERDLAPGDGNYRLTLTLPTHRFTPPDEKRMRLARFIILEAVPYFD
jgi:hypothetical protein